MLKEHEHLPKHSSFFEQRIRQLLPTELASNNAIIESMLHHFGDLDSILHFTTPSQALTPLGTVILKYIQHTLVDTQHFDKVISVIKPHTPLANSDAPVGITLASKFLFLSMSHESVHGQYGYHQSTDTASISAGLMLHVPTIPLFQRKNGLIQVWKKGEDMSIVYHYPTADVNFLTFTTQHRPALQVGVERLFRQK